MDANFNEDLIAELAAMNTVLIKCMSSIGVLAKQEGMPPKLFFERHLKSGEEALAKTDYWSIPADRRDILIEKARARLTDILNASYRATAGLGK